MRPGERGEGRAARKLDIRNLESPVSAANPEIAGQSAVSEETGETVRVARGKGRGESGQEARNSQLEVAGEFRKRRGCWPVSVQ